MEDKEKNQVDEMAKSLMESVKALIDAEKKENEAKQAKEVKTEVTYKDQVAKMDKTEKISEFVKSLVMGSREKLQILSEGTAALGGYLVPEVWLNDIIMEMREDSQIRQRARVIPMTTDTLNITQLVSRPKASFRSEKAVKSTSTAQFDQISLTPYSLAVIVPLTQELSQDASVGLTGSLIDLLTDLIATSMREREERAFISGNGTGQPTGIDNYAGTVHRIVATPANVINADSLIEVISRLGTKYLKNAVWIMNSVTWRKAMQLKDSQNRYLFIADPTGKTPGTILGYPVIRQDDLDQSHIWFGDLKGYIIGIREGMSVKVSDEATVASQSAFEQNLIYIRVEERIDAELADLDSMVVLTGTN